jgi:hypothetical protein
MWIHWELKQFKIATVEIYSKKSCSNGYSVILKKNNFAYETVWS